ncbi:SgcJ/EcaC family oxidoreductase [Qaidamihabitans albus]|uniref:SgcJ/EcaC family oxidoreductase n=1 Tax=Qaidamihabitans albus TaxID=2795733 RepID=UPI0018F1939A|nr:SgcJ/EcaC family oxidoreductase [Qaidamihabitans albus]
MTHEENVTAIRRLVADAERYQNDVGRFVALHTADAIIVNIAGVRVLGRDAIEQAMSRALASPLAKVLTRTEIEDIRFVGPEVAIVSCVKHVSDQRDTSAKEEQGESLPTRGSLGYVVVREQDAWRIASAQTTPVRAA